MTHCPWEFGWDALVAIGTIALAFAAFAPICADACRRRRVRKALAKALLTELLDAEKVIGGVDDGADVSHVDNVIAAINANFGQQNEGFRAAYFTAPRSALATAMGNVSVFPVGLAAAIIEFDAAIDRLVRMRSVRSLSGNDDADARRKIYECWQEAMRAMRKTIALLQAGG